MIRPLYLVLCLLLTVPAFAQEKAAVVPTPAPATDTTVPAQPPSSWPEPDRWTDDTLITRIGNKQVIIEQQQEYLAKAKGVVAGLDKELAALKAENEKLRKDLEKATGKKVPTETTEAKEDPKKGG